MVSRYLLRTSTPVQDVEAVLPSSPTAFGTILLAAIDSGPFVILEVDDVVDHRPVALGQLVQP